MRLPRMMLSFFAMSFTFAATIAAQEVGPQLVHGNHRNPSFAVIGRQKARQSPIVKAVKRVADAVVNIHSERSVRPVAIEPFQILPSQGRVNGMGTGVIVDPRGYIVTNHHVVEDVNVLRIRLRDGKAKDAVVVARNPKLDLALIKIEVDRPLTVMPIGTSIDLMPGETVVAVGNAFGYKHTVSVGVVSAIKRDVRLNKDMSYKSLIQTDASINPGNSGGPLVNIHGEMVGVNVAIRAGAQGIGFAIPVDHVVLAVTEMLHNHRQSHYFDGFSFEDRLEKHQDGYIRKVVVKNVVAHGPAALAGLSRGDVLTKISDIPIRCGFDVERALLGKNIGEQIPFHVFRSGQFQMVKLALQTSQSPANKVAELVWEKLGMLLAPVPAEKVVRVSDRLHGGLEIRAVHADRAAAKAGILQGDILVGLHQWETLSIENIVYVLEHPDMANFHPLRFFIVREGQVRRGLLHIAR